MNLRFIIKAGLAWYKLNKVYKKLMTFSVRNYPWVKPNILKYQK
jgi:hypothetical protein